MAWLTIYKITTDGTLEQFAFVSDPRFGAPFVWHRLYWRYLADKKATQPPSLTEELLKSVFALADDERLSLDERIVLKTTFDYAMVKRENIGRLIEAMNKFMAGYNGDAGGCNFKDQITVLEILAIDATCQAVAWCQIDKTESMWDVKTEDGSVRPYNINTESKHWFVFAEQADGE